MKWHFFFITEPFIRVKIIFPRTFFPVPALAFSSASNLLEDNSVLSSNSGVLHLSLSLSLSLSFCQHRLALFFFTKRSSFFHFGRESCLKWWKSPQRDVVIFFYHSEESNIKYLPITAVKWWKIFHNCQLEASGPSG